MTHRNALSVHKGTYVFSIRLYHTSLSGLAYMNMEHTHALSLNFANAKSLKSLVDLYSSPLSFYCNIECTSYSTVIISTVLALYLLLAKNN